MHLFLELTTLCFFLLCVVHAVGLRGGRGRRLMAMMMWLGFVRETFVVLARYLYGYADLNLKLGVAPVIAAIIWGYSIYVAICFAELVTKRDFGTVIEAGVRSRVAALWIGAASAFMICLVGFYEPFLELVGMARWEDGTLKTAGVPWIACIGYPTLTAGFLVLWLSLERRWTGLQRLWGEVGGCVALALVHAWGLQVLKDGLAW